MHELIFAHFTEGQKVEFLKVAYSFEWILVQLLGSFSKGSKEMLVQAKRSRKPLESHEPSKAFRPRILFLFSTLKVKNT